MEVTLRVTLLVVAQAVAAVVAAALQVQGHQLKLKQGLSFFNRIQVTSNILQTYKACQV